MNFSNNSRAGYPVVVFAAAAIFLTCLPCFDAQAVEPDMVVMVPMSDGVALSTNVFLPDPDIFAPPYSIVMARTPYANILGQIDDATAGMIVSWLVDMFGLALVVQDTRGTGGSEGVPDAFFSDWLDGPDLVDWLVEQDWSNGQVMQFGLSALAIPGYLAAPEASDNLKCQFLGEASPDMYDLGVFHGGVFKKATVEAWLSWVGASSKLSELEQHRNCDDYWDTLIIDRLPGDIHTAAMHIGGWYDVFVEGTIAGYRAYSDRGDEWAAANQYLVIGPWDHSDLAESLGVAESAGYSSQSELLAWVSYCLAGDDSIVSGWPRVRYYVMGSREEGAPGNEWRSARDWPLPTEYVEFEIREDGSLLPVIDADAPAAPVFAAGVPDEESVVLPVSLPFSHRDYSPVVGGRNLVSSSGPRELSSVLARDDYVMFTTVTFDEPFESIGKMSIELDVSTSFADADVIVRLVDIYPDGETWIIGDGAARMSRRNGCEAPAEVKSGEQVTLDVDLLSSAVSFNTGHKIGVIVTTTMYRKYEFNPTLLEESKKNGPIAEAVVIYGGRLMMPVAQPEPVIPETVEQADVVEFVEYEDRDVIVGDIPVMTDIVADIETDVSDSTGDTSGFDSQTASDTTDRDTVNSDAETSDAPDKDPGRDVGLFDISLNDIGMVETTAPDGWTDHDEITVGVNAGGCSAGKDGSSSASLFFLFFISLLAVALGRVSRRSC